VLSTAPLAALVTSFLATILLPRVIAQHADSAAERVVVTTVENTQENTTIIDPYDLGLTGDIRRIGSIASNVSINEAGADSFTDVYAVRGLNNTPNFSKQALTIYVDDVPSVSTFTNFTELGALESIELIRGPQGDLAGKNAEAGLLNIRTIVPDGIPRVIASTTRASYDYWTGDALVSGAIVSNILFAKLEGGYLSRDGYLENTFLDTRPDFQQHAFGRIQLRLVPTPEWEIDLSGEAHYIRDGVQRFVPLSSPDPFRVTFDFDGKTNIDGNIEALRIIRTLDNVRLALITSWREWALDPYTADFDYSRVPFVRGRFDLEQTQFAQEVRIESREPESDFHWRFGGFSAHITNGGSETFAAGPFLKMISFDENEAQFALFGEATEDFESKFSLTLGMRAEYDVDRIDRQREVSFSPRTSFNSHHNEWNTQPKVVFTYTLTPDLRVYASSAYGYRNGGFSFLETTPRFASYGAEHIWANEIGAYGNYFDSRFELRAAAFVNRIEDYQVERLSIPPNIAVFNAPLVLAYGGEVEVTAKPFAGLDVKSTFGYTHSQFAHFNDLFSGANLSEKGTPFSPEFTAALRGRYTLRGFFTEAELLAAGEAFYDEQNTASIRQAPHAQINSRIGYQHLHLLFYLYAENLNDARYFTQKIAYAGIGTPAPPRTFGVALSIKL
jgi:iron complex outermembrane recepter protein